MLLGLSRRLNAALGGARDETLSHRMGQDVAAGRCRACRLACWLLDKIDPNHCAAARR